MPLLKGFLVFALALTAGCSGGGDDFETVACAAGKTQACVCEDGAMGAQLCNPNGTAWGKCMCAAAPEGSGGGAGSGGAGGSAGVPQKECSSDEDCGTKAKPYCVGWACVAPTLATAGDPCGHGIECDSSSYCDIGADGSNPNPYCLAKKGTGKSCYMDSQCTSASCAGVCL